MVFLWIITLVTNQFETLGWSLKWTQLLASRRQDQGDTQELISTRDGGPDQDHGDTSGGADVDHTYQPSRTDTLWENADVKWWNW